MESVVQFNTELKSILSFKPPISRAKMASITKLAMKSVKLYKHVVMHVERFISKCPPEFKVPGLYVIDSIVRQSKHQMGAEKDCFGPRFTRNLVKTFQHIFQCTEEDRPKVVRVLNLWQKNGVFTPEVIQPLLSLAPGGLSSSNGISLERENLLQTQRQPAQFSPSKGQPATMDAPKQKEDRVARPDQLNEPQTVFPGSQPSLHNSALLLGEPICSPEQYPASEPMREDSPSPPPQTSYNNSNTERSVQQSHHNQMFNQALLNDFDYSDEDDDTVRNNHKGTGLGVQGPASRSSNEPTTPQQQAPPPAILTNDPSRLQNSLPPANVMQYPPVRLPGPPMVQPPLSGTLPQQHGGTLPPPPPQGHPSAPLPSGGGSFGGNATHGYHLPPGMQGGPFGTFHGGPPPSHHGPLPSHQHGIPLPPHSGPPPRGYPLPPVPTRGPNPHNFPPRGYPTQGLSSGHNPMQGGPPPPPGPNTAPSQRLPPAHPSMPHVPPPPIVPSGSQKPSHPGGFSSGPAMLSSSRDRDLPPGMNYGHHPMSSGPPPFSSHQPPSSNPPGPRAERYYSPPPFRGRSPSPSRRTWRDKDRDKWSPLRRRSRSPPMRERRSRSPMRRNSRGSRSPVKGRRPSEGGDRHRKGGAHPKEGHYTVCSTTIWVGHLPKNVTQSQIGAEFEKFGTVKSVDVVQARGCAYVVMLQRSEASRALNTLKDLRLNGTSCKLAWAPGRGVKGAAYKNYWDIDLGISFIPWEKVQSQEDLNSIVEGGWIDPATCPPGMKPAPQTKSETARAAVYDRQSPDRRQSLLSPTLPLVAGVPILPPMPPQSNLHQGMGVVPFIAAGSMAAAGALPYHNKSSALPPPATFPSNTYNEKQPSFRSPASLDETLSHDEDMQLDNGDRESSVPLERPGSRDGHQQSNPLDGRGPLPGQDIGVVDDAFDVPAQKEFSVSERDKFGVSGEMEVQAGGKAFDAPVGKESAAADRREKGREEQNTASTTGN